MADTRRELIIQEALTQLAKITVANGYQYTMSTPKRGVKNIDTKDFPLSVVFPAVEENERKFAKNVLTFSIRVESHAIVGSVNPSIIQEKMLGDLIKNLTNPSDAWTTKTEDIAYFGGGPAEQPEAEDTTTAVYAIFTIKYKTNIGSPYTNT